MQCPILQGQKITARSVIQAARSAYKTYVHCTIYSYNMKNKKWQGTHKESFTQNSFIHFSIKFQYKTWKDMQNPILQGQNITARTRGIEASSSKHKPALKKNKTPSTRRREAKRYDQWVLAKSSAVTSAEVIPSCDTASVDQNHQTEARTSLEGIGEITPTKYQDGPEVVR
ncbi:unnamed protein product [Mytilus edulis]|uniref:Uncharacterized protein n=1 Tax=Mytilus edulis TaxID=6550 RepID=A0A8S3VCM3_MYTED|nr:unnamed protein product [Mytilus edulis]